MLIRIILLLTMITSSQATLIHNHGTKSKGLGGASIAFPQDAMASTSNPAGMVFVGTRIDMGVSILSPLREYVNNSAPNLNTAIFPPFTEQGTRLVESDSNYFPIPHSAANYMIDENSSIGYSMAFVGVNTDYPPVDPLGQRSNSGTFGGGPTGADVVHGELTPTYARKFGNIAFGVSAVLAYQRMEIRGTSLFGSNIFGLTLPGPTDPAVLIADNDPNNFSDRGFDHAFGLGLKLGLLWQVSPKFNLGLSYSSEVFSQDADKYADIIPGNDNAINNPPQYGLGLAWRPLNSLVFVFDYHFLDYPKVPFYGNTFQGFIDNCLLPVIPGSENFGNQQNNYCFGGSQGPGVGWKEVTIYRFGVQWEQNKETTWRIGFSHGNNPIRNTEILFAVLLPTITEDTYAIGFSKVFNAKYELDISAFYSPENTLTGPLQQVDISVSQFEVEINWGIRF